MTTIKEVTQLAQEAHDECEKLSHRSDGLTSYERGEQYRKSLNLSQNVKEKINELAIDHLKQLNIDHLFDTDKDFIFNEGWTIDEYKNIEGMDTLNTFGNAVYHAATAESELQYVETERITDSQPFGRAGMCAREQLQHTVEHLEEIQQNQ